MHFAILRSLTSKSHVQRKSELKINLVKQMCVRILNHLLHPVSINTLIKISLNDAICALPKSSILNAILKSLGNDFCSVVVTNDCIQTLWLLIVNECKSANSLQSNYFPPFESLCVLLECFCKCHPYENLSIKDLHKKNKR